VVAKALDFEHREILREALGFLQAQHVGLRILEEGQKMGQSRLDRIDVPAGDLHKVKRV